MRNFSCHAHQETVANGFATNNRSTKKFGLESEMQDILRSALPSVVFTVPEGIQCTECTVHRKCKTCDLEPDVNEKDTLAAIAEAKTGQGPADQQESFISLADVDHYCQVSKAIYESKLSLWEERIPNQEEAGHQNTQKEQKSGGVIIYEAYVQLLEHFRRTQKGKPGFESQIEQFVMVKGLLKGSSDLIGQMEKTQTTLEDQLKVTQEMLTMALRDQGVKKVRLDQQQPEEPPLTRMLQTLDQATQCEIKFHEQFPRHYIHHSALVHADSRPKGSSLQPIDPQLYQEVILALRDNWSFTKKMNTGNEIGYEDLATVSEGNWVNDIALYEYLQLVCQTANERGEAELSGTFQCLVPYFGTDIQKGVPMERLNKLTSKVDITEAQGVLIPMNISAKHWTLFVADLHTRTVFTLDSGERFNSTNMESLGWQVACYMRTWTGEQKCRSWTEGWQVQKRESPQQRNSTDCGAFVAQFARAIALEGDNIWDVRQENMRHLRKRMIQELFFGRLFPM